MNKFLTKIAGVVASLAMVIGVGVGVASKQAKGAYAETTSLTFNLSTNPGGWPTSNSTTETEYTYTLNTVDYVFTLKNVKCNSGYLMLTSTAALGLPTIAGQKLTKVIAHNSGGCSTSTNVGISKLSSDEDYVTGGSKQTWSKTNSDYTYTLSNTVVNTRYYLYVTNKNSQVTSLELTYETVSGPVKSNVTLSCEDVELDISDDPITLSVSAVSNAEPVNGLEYTYDIDDESVATVSNSGEVTPVAVGETELTINFAGDENYNPASKTISVTVSDKRLTISSLVFNAQCGGSGTSDDNAEWTVTSDGSESSFDNIRGIHFGTSSADVTYLQLSTSDLSGSVKRVVVNASDAQSVASLSVTVGDETFSPASETLTSSNAEYIFTGDARGQIVVKLERNETMKKGLYVKSVVVYYVKANLSSITLSGTYKTAFEQGDEFDHTGMIVTANFDDESHLDVTSESSWDGYNMSISGQQTVTVSYGGKTATYDITVAETTMYTVSGTISNGSLSSTNSVREGNALNISINAEQKYDRPVTLNVTMNGTPLANGDGYSYDSSTGNFSIAAVTGNVVINGTCTKTSGLWPETAFTVAEAIPAINQADGNTIEGAYVRGIISQIDSYSSKYNSITYWISDDGTTNNQLKVYSGKGLDGADFDSVDNIETLASVVIKGDLTIYQEVHEFDKNNELVSYIPATKHLVTFVSNGGTDVPSAEVVDGQKVSRPTDPTKASDETYNYSFVGWYDNKEFNGNQFDFNTPITEDITLYAKWNSVLIPAKDVIEDSLLTNAALSYSDYNRQGNGSIDTLTKDFIGVSNSYTDWSDKSGESGVVYAGNSYGASNYIQLNTGASYHQGIITTANANNHDIKKITIKWNASTTNGRYVQIFGKNTAYTSKTDLYSDQTYGDVITSLSKNSSNDDSVYEFTSSYKYIGIKASGALYINSIEIQWGELPTYTYSNLKIRFNAKISQELWTRLDSESTITGYGMLLSTTDAIKNDNIADYYGLADDYRTSPDIKNTVAIFPNTIAVPNLSEGNYGWSLHKSISLADYKTTYIAMAYIVTEDDGVIFLDEIRASAKSLAGDLIQAGTYAENAFGGSLKYLADYQ